jgi:hypothetical protein
MIDIAGKHLSESEIEELLSTDHPLVENFLFVKKYESETHLSFRIDIHPKIGVEFLQQRDSSGRRIVPVKRVTTVDDRIGSANRTISLSVGRLFAENQTFFPNQEFNDLGIGSALYESQERLYRALGIEKISLLAVDVGRYAWARQGFECEHRFQLKEMVKEFTEFLKKKELEPPASIEHIWDIAGYVIGGASFDDDPVGKYWMLIFSDCWEGCRVLDDPLSNRVAEAARAATKERRKLRIHPYS